MSAATSISLQAMLARVRTGTMIMDMVMDTMTIED
jgi:hypothetical protein